MLGHIPKVFGCLQTSDKYSTLLFDKEFYYNEQFISKVAMNHPNQQNC